MLLDIEYAVIIYICRLIRRGRWDLPGNYRARVSSLEVGSKVFISPSLPGLSG